MTDQESTKAQLLAELAALRRRVTELEAGGEGGLLNRVARLWSSSLDLDQVLASVLEEVNRSLGVIASSVWLIDPQTAELVCRQTRGPGSGIVQGWRLEVGQGIAGWVARAGRGVIVADAQLDQRHFEGLDGQTGVRTRSVLTVPLRVKESVTGVIQVVDSAVGRFSPLDLSLLGSLASSAAFAIDNAMLYARAQHEIAKREQATEALQESERKLRSIIEQSHDGIVLVDRQGTITEWNHGQEEIAGLQRAQVLGRPLWDVQFQALPQEHRTPMARQRAQAAMAEFLETGYAPWLNQLGENEIQRPDGVRRVVQTLAFPIQTDDGPIAGSIVRDITVRKRAEEQLRASLEAKEVLLKEIHHRVRNNLAIISSLLEQQSRVTEHPATRDALQDCKGRVSAMAYVHHQLYASQDLSQVDMAPYIRELCAHLRRLHDAYHVAFVIEVPEGVLDISAAVPCGLILNELITNALKYAFPPVRDRDSDVASEVRVTFRREMGGAYELTVSDNGIGLSPGFDQRVERTLGLTLIEALVEQLEGSMAWQSGPGTTCRILFTP